MLFTLAEITIYMLSPCRYCYHAARYCCHTYAVYDDMLLRALFSTTPAMPMPADAVAALAARTCREAFMLTRMRRPFERLCHEQRSVAPRAGRNAPRVRIRACARGTARRSSDALRYAHVICAPTYALLIRRYRRHAAHARVPAMPRCCATQQAPASRCLSNARVRGAVCCFAERYDMMLRAYC